MKSKKRPTLKFKKYELGDYVTPDNISALGTIGSGLLQSQMDPHKVNRGLSIGSGALSGATTGATIGSVIPGVGTAIGAGVGAVAGGIAGSIGADNKARELANYNKDFLKNATRINESHLNGYNINPYGTQMFADGGPIKSKQPFLVEKKDGTIGQWGNPLIQDTISTPIIPQIPLSDKAKGLSNTYFPANNQMQSKSISTQYPSKRYADGGETQSNIINIEKGELQIDPSTGKILRTYKGINPETGGLYENHAKKESKETPNNLVQAEPETFIITKKLGSDYQKAIDENDKMKQNTILMNIKNSKDAKSLTPQFKYGSYVPKFDDGGYNPKPFQSYSSWSNQIGYPLGFKNGLPNNTPIPISDSGVYSNDYSRSPTSQFTSNTTSPLQTIQNDQKPTIGSQLSAYAPAIINLTQGLAGKIDTAPRASFISNPYKSQIIANLPKDINTDSIINEQYGLATAANKDLETNSNNSSTYRANRQQLGSNTQRAIAGTRLQGQIQNNSIAAQRAGIYGQLASQDLQEQERVQALNTRADEQDIASRGAKQNLFNTGITQLQQTQQNQKNNKTLSDIDLYKLSLLKDLNPFAKYYSNLGGQDQTSSIANSGVFSTRYKKGSFVSKSKLKK